MPQDDVMHRELTVIERWHRSPEWPGCWASDRWTPLIHLLQAPVIACLVVLVFGEASAVSDAPGLRE